MPSSHSFRIPSREQIAISISQLRCSSPARPRPGQVQFTGLRQHGHQPKTCATCARTSVWWSSCQDIRKACGGARAMTYGKHVMELVPGRDEST
jgi:hypothetical protein